MTLEILEIALILVSLLGLSAGISAVFTFIWWMIEEITK